VRGDAVAQPSPLEGEGGARPAQPGGRVRGRGYEAPTLAKAKILRRDMTDAERRLWSILRGAQLDGAKFRRQQPIGPYIADFVCQSHRLIVEVDGGQHSVEADAARTAWLDTAGYRVIRFWNDDVLFNLDGVATEIARALVTPHPPTASRRAPPSPSRGEGFDGALNG
jgi:very-short-patch-repair endonuclease